MGSINENLLYSETHHWVDLKDNDICVIGITDFAQEQIGDILFVDLPESGENIFKGQEYASIESAKTVTELVSPITGNIIEVNTEISTNPEIINKEPYTKGWLIKVKLSDKSEINSLLSPEEYRDAISFSPINVNE